MTQINTDETLQEFFDSLDKLTYLKRTGEKGGYSYWYWHRKLQRIVYEKKPDRHLVASRPCYRHDPREKNRPLQAGDVVFHFRSMSFAVLYAYKGDLWYAKNRKSKRVRYRTKCLILVAANLIWDTGAEEDNLIGAQLQAELDFAEALGYKACTDDIIRKLPSIPIGENTLKRLHRLMFEQVYAWAGEYREEELVVGVHDSPTLPQAEVAEAVKIFFQDFNNPLLRRAYERGTGYLLGALLKFHVEMAWIHPFKDGNGRVIRIMCSLIALEWGHELRWNVDKGRKRQQYHKAVRYAVHNKRLKYLRHIIKQGLHPV
ncbi:MAG: hypothetical protein GY862_25070 [Gammaproteobacteria bacterium]|nr:hypothetical protein [Gammaproteobacteria bacterium]